jgi:hypothetical protein
LAHEQPHILVICFESGLLPIDEERFLKDAANFPLSNYATTELPSDLLFDEAGSEQKVSWTSASVRQAALGRLGLIRRRAMAEQLIVLDGLNVALAHGRSEFFSVEGLKIAIDYFQMRGHSVLVCLPRPATSKENKRRAPRNITELIAEELIVFTPPQDYDDSYTLQLAQNRNGIIVSNDMFRDWVSKDERRRKEWIQTHVISYAFAGHEFIPNPDFPKSD